MNTALLKKHIVDYMKQMSEDAAKYAHDLNQRLERIRYYKGWTKPRILQMQAEDLYEYLAGLWAMLIWGNKHYVVDKLIKDHSLEHVRTCLADLVWSEAPVVDRWEKFRKSVKGMGPAMISEILCYTHPDDCMVWNRRALVGFKYLEVPDLPRYDYQLTGAKYIKLTQIALQIREELRKAGLEDANLLTVDYFIWDRLQPEGSLNKVFENPDGGQQATTVELADTTTAEFIHNEVRDKLAEIGKWLGLATRTEAKVAEGSVVDTVWEATIGNMGRVIYVFEVQTKGSIDSLTVNLLKSLNNPAVQGVVAVSDAVQLEKIKKHMAAIPGLAQKMKYWDYLQVLEVHTALQGINEIINSLGLVPQGF